MHIVIQEEEEVENLAPETQADGDQNFFQFGGGDADAGKPKGGFRL